MKFTDFDLRPELLEAINALGFQEATPIQEAVIPQVLRGKDVSGLAQTGTGKTAAFVIPLIDRILRLRAGEEGDRVPKNWKKNSFVLVLVPTRELATQVEETIVQLGKKAGMRSVVVVGGSAYDEQRGALRQGVEFVVGTPGRLLDLYKSHDLDLNGVGAVVFDEADRMFDMGFKDDMKFLLRRMPRERQFLLFSATLNFDVLNTAYQFGAEPVEFNVSRDQVTAEGIDHEILQLGQDEKPMFLLSILRKLQPTQCIVFSNFKHNVKPIARFLKDNGIEAIEMSSLLSQAQRNKVLEAFKAGSKQILVATDVAARGLDVKGIDLVVNYDLPDDPEGYVHRIGRTGRAGGSGRAVGLVSDRDVEALMRVENYLKEKIKIGWMEDADLVKEFVPLKKEFEREDRGPGFGRGGPRGGRGPGGRPGRGGERGDRGGRGGGRPQRGGERRPQLTKPGQQNPVPAEGATEGGVLPPVEGTAVPTVAASDAVPSSQQEGRTHSRGGRHPRERHHGPNGDRHPRHGRDRHGGQNRQERPAQNREGQGEPPSQEPRQDRHGHGQTAEGPNNAVANQHRDRRMGRHGGIANAATGGNSENRERQQGGERHGRGRGGRGRGGRGHGRHEGQHRNEHSRSAHGNAPHRRPLRKDQAGEKAGVGQKIKSFFSKLFK